MGQHAKVAVEGAIKAALGDASGLDGLVRVSAPEQAIGGRRSLPNTLY
jgi:hypothetical protein